MNSFDKALLVCSESCEEVEKCLVMAGCKITKVIEGEMAVSKARREIFDAAVLVSTGREMDLPETVLNLRDLRGSMPILIITGAGDADQSAATKGMVARLVPNTKVLSLPELKTFIESMQGCGRKQKGTFKVSHFGRKI